MYRYEARLIRWVDGDTADLDVDLGFHLSHAIRVRLFGVDCPELHTPEGKSALAFVLGIVPVGSAVEIVTVKDRTEKYGRYLASIYRDGESVVERLIAAGHVKRASAATS